MFIFLVVVSVNFLYYCVFSQKATQGQDTKQESSSSSNANNNSEASPQLNNNNNNDNTMVYEGGYDQSEISKAMCTHVLQSQTIIASIIITVIWRLCQLF
jgi:hypothetical protein